MEVLVRACGHSPPSLLSHGGPRDASEGLLRGAKPAVSAGQELSSPQPGGSAIRFAHPVWVARGIPSARARRGVAFSRGRERRGAAPAGAGDSRALVIPQELDQSLG